MDIWALLGQDAPDGCASVQDLYSWSLNYDSGRGPFVLFLDLIGYSEEEYGETLYNMRTASLGYLELDKLADALKEYIDAPGAVTGYVARLMLAEAGDLEDEEEEEDATEEED